MSRLVLMRGLPGSGKSYLANLTVNRDRQEIILSTDDYWKRPDGFYDFNPKRIKEAHDHTFGSFKFFLDLGRGIILDNTNIRRADFARYVEAAKEAGYKIEELIPTTPWAWDVQECFARNKHKVPLEVIQNMKNKWED